MRGPIRMIRSKEIVNYRNLGPIYEWADGRAYLIIDRVIYNEKAGAILCYHNPPVHQVGTTGLYAYHDGLDSVSQKKDELDFLMLYGANDPVHSGGDLKESLSRLTETLEAKREKESSGASAQEIDRLFSWAENRLEKGIILYKKIRNIAQSMRAVGVCGGGLRFGGSAEILLMTDYLLGDSRSGICFSEAMIGLIPGWGGITRVMIKAGLRNAEYMTKTAKPIHASGLEAIGIYNKVVEVPFRFPSRQKTGNPETDRERYRKALEEHDDRTGLLLLPAGLELATCPEQEIPARGEGERKTLASREEIAPEVSRRVEPHNYSHLWGKPLRDVKKDITELGRPLAPQSIGAADLLLKEFEASVFDEEQFVRKEMEANAALYRDPRFLEGLRSMLDQRVPDFRVPVHS